VTVAHSDSVELAALLLLLLLLLALNVFCRLNNTAYIMFSSVFRYIHPIVTAASQIRGLVVPFQS
jgi:hypothetical protein